jgi:hypothetical protein
VYHTAIEAELCKGDVSFVNMVMSGLQYTSEGNTRLSCACSINPYGWWLIYLNSEAFIECSALSFWLKGIKLDNNRLCA